MATAIRALENTVGIESLHSFDHWSAAASAQSRTTVQTCGRRPAARQVLLAWPPEADGGCTVAKVDVFESVSFEAILVEQTCSAQRRTGPVSGRGEPASL